MSPNASHQPLSSALEAMTQAEQAQVLAELLARHPELRQEAEELAQAQLASVTAEDVAGEVAWTLENQPWETIAGRVGYQPGQGYVHPNEAAWDILEEALQPFLDHIGRLARLGLDEAAVAVALGVIAGLYECRDASDGTVLGEAGADAVGELADEAVRVLQQAGLALPPDAVEQRWADWPGPLGQ